MLNIEFCGAKLLYNIQHIKIPARLAELARLAGIDGKSMRINWLFANDHDGITMDQQGVMNLKPN